MAASIEFVNHASVLVLQGSVGVLSDPWYAGAVFHKGWSLLHENEEADIRDLLGRTTHIWISHEHPDHFSPPFFMKYRDLILARDIKVLFQSTADGRVTEFLHQKGFAVIEVAEGECVSLSSDFELRIVKSDLYDSALLMEVEGTHIFNLNDCPLHDDKILSAFVRQYGTCDVLLTQFSYAAWKGGRRNSAWRNRAAKSKLNAMRQQFRYLKPKICIPFASFVYFSNQLNGYMNDEVNTPSKVAEALKNETAELIFLKPGEVQDLSCLKGMPASQNWWQRTFENAETLPQIAYAESIQIADLQTGFDIYQQRIFSKNSKFLMRLSQRILPIHPFGKTSIYLADLNKTVSIDMLGSLSETKMVADIEMHSASLDFMFRNDFGFDTLFVNGCFEEASDDGFSRFAKCFAIGNLNAMGLYIGPAILKRLDVIFLLLRKMQVVRRNMVK